MKILYFALGAGIGAPTRYVIDSFFRSNYRFPIGILIVNIFGSFLLAIISKDQSQLGYALLGFCGALTTWSAFSLDLFSQRSKLRDFAVNLFGNYFLGIAAAILGVWIRQ
jgi:CrcB protein